MYSSRINLSASECRCWGVMRMRMAWQILGSINLSLSWPGGSSDNSWNSHILTSYGCVGLTVGLTLCFASVSSHGGTDALRWAKRAGATVTNAHPIDGRLVRRGSTTTSADPHARIHSEVAKILFRTPKPEMRRNVNRNAFVAQNQRRWHPLRAGQLRFGCWPEPPTPRGRATLGCPAERRPGPREASPRRPVGEGRGGGREGRRRCPWRGASHGIRRACKQDPRLCAARAARGTGGRAAGARGRERSGEALHRPFLGHARQIDRRDLSSTAVGGRGIEGAAGAFRHGARGAGAGWRPTRASTRTRACRRGRRSVPRASAGTRRPAVRGGGTGGIGAAGRGDREPQGTVNDGPAGGGAGQVGRRPFPTGVQRDTGGASCPGGASCLDGRGWG